MMKKLRLTAMKDHHSSDAALVRTARLKETILKKHSKLKPAESKGNTE